MKRHGTVQVIANPSTEAIEIFPMLPMLHGQVVTDVQGLIWSGALEPNLPVTVDRIELGWDLDVMESYWLHGLRNDAHKLRYRFEIVVGIRVVGQQYTWRVLIDGVMRGQEVVEKFCWRYVGCAPGDKVIGSGPMAYSILMELSESNCSVSVAPVVRALLCILPAETAKYHCRRLRIEEEELERKHQDRVRGPRETREDLIRQLDELLTEPESNS